MKAKENPLNQSVTGNPYYDYLIHEVQVVCNCPTDKAMAIVSYVNSLGSSPRRPRRTKVWYLFPGRLRKPKGKTPPGKGST